MNWPSFRWRLVVHPRSQARARVLFSMVRSFSCRAIVASHVPRHFYPLMLDLHGWAVLVVGAGRVAERKIRAALAAGARVTVVAPQATPAIRSWARTKRLLWRMRKFRRSDIRGRRICVCATNRPEVDRLASRTARQAGLLVNCASEPALGNFLVPASARSGAVLTAVSTGGASPNLARRIAREIGAGIGRDYAALAELLRELRPTVIAQVPRSRRAALWRQLCSERMKGLMRQRQRAEGRRIALQLIQAASQVRRAD